MDRMYSELVSRSSSRNHTLIETRQLHTYNRLCGDVRTWICEKELVAANEDLGKDVEHVEVSVMKYTELG